MTTVYVDVLFCTNLIINYFLILFSAKFCSLPYHRIRYLAASLVGAVYSLAIFLPELNTFFNIAMKLILGTTILFIAYGIAKPKQFFRRAAVFFGVNFGFAGIMLALWIAFHPKNMAINNGVFYFDISPWLLVTASVVTYLAATVIMKFSKRKAPEQLECNIEISTELGSVLLEGFVDTGNDLCDLFTERPVVVVPVKSVEKIIPTEYLPAFRDASLSNANLLDGHWATEYRLIPFNALSGTGIMPAFKPKAFYVYEGNTALKVKDVMVAVSAGEIHGDKAIINPKILENTKGSNDKCLVK